MIPVGYEIEIKLQNISKQEFSCNRSSLGVPVWYTLRYRFKGVRSSVSPQVRLGFGLVRIKFG